MHHVTDHRGRPVSADPDVRSRRRPTDATDVVPSTILGDRCPAAGVPRNGVRLAFIG